MEELNIDHEQAIPFTTSAYRGANVVAASIRDHLLFHHSSAATRFNREQLGPKPDTAVIEAIIDTTFWASLRKEEGRSPTISIAFLSPEKCEQPLVFEKKLDFTPYLLTKLAPAVERPGIHLGVWVDEGKLYIWGTTRHVPPLCFILEVVEPGMLVVKHRRADGFGKFVNIAVLKGDQVKVIDEATVKVPDCPKVINSMLGFKVNSLWNDSLNTLVQLAVSMRAHGRGGTLLMVPTGKHDWKDSIIHPVSYSVSPSFSELAWLNQQVSDPEEQPLLQGRINQAIERLAGLTAVDGATIVNDQYELLAFGAKIARASGAPPVEQILATEPVVGYTGKIVHPAQNGGTRHLSAAQFVSDQHDAIALVASQDGRFTIFSWSTCEQIVQAHRVDVLLL